MKRLALVGYGRIAPKHLETFRDLGAEFVACCNRSEAGREKAMREGGIPRTFENISAMIDETQPAGIVCCASLDQVAPAAREILPFGIPTLLEKPPGTTFSEWQELCKLAEKYRTPVMVGLNRRHYSVLSRAMEDAGGPEAITAVFVEWSEDPQHCLSRGLSTAQVERMVFGNSLHGLHLLTFLGGEFPTPSVAVKNLGMPYRWMMGVQGVSTRGVLGSFTSTWDSPGGWRLTVCSPGRRYTFAPLESCKVQQSGAKELRQIDADEHDTRFKPGFYRQSQEFLESIETRRVTKGVDLRDVGPAMQLAEDLTNALLSKG